MVQHEADAVAATTGTAVDLDAQSEAARRFARDLQAFAAAARTAWNYMNQAADAAGCREWLDGRLENDPLCRFHRELANQDTHAHEAIVGVQQQMSYEADASTPMVSVPTGGFMPAQVTVVAFEGVTFHYNPKEFGSDVMAWYERVTAVYGNKSVLELALRYFGALESAFKNAERRGRFTLRSTTA